MRADGAGKAAAPGSEESILSSIHGTVRSRELLPLLPCLSQAGLRPQTYLFPEEPVTGMISRTPPADQFLQKTFQTSCLLSYSDPKPANVEATACCSCTLHRWDLAYSKPDVQAAPISHSHRAAPRIILQDQLFPAMFPPLAAAPALVLTRPASVLKKDGEGSVFLPGYRANSTTTCCSLHFPASQLSEDTNHIYSVLSLLPLPYRDLSLELFIINRAFSSKQAFPCLRHLLTVATPSA